MAWRVFYSYSHADTEARKTLGKYLAPLVPNKIAEDWHDRKIEAGGDWQSEISAHLESANLVLLLVSESFLESDYCFGVEVERALARLKRGEVKVVPILLKPCLWEESKFSLLQIIPRDGKPISESASAAGAYAEVAREIRDLVSASPPEAPPEHDQGHNFDSSLGLVRGQVRAYAQLYERIRQRMRGSDERTRRMEGFSKRCVHWQMHPTRYSTSSRTVPLLENACQQWRFCKRLPASDIYHFWSTWSVPSNHSLDI